MKKIYYCKEKHCKNKIHRVTFLNGLGRCRSCAKKGDRHPNYKGPDKIKKYNNQCIDCQVKISHQGVRCRSCAKKGNKHPLFGLVNKNCPNWKGGRNKCIDCNKILSNYKGKRCKLCAYKELKKLGVNKEEKNGMYKHGKYSESARYYCIDCNKQIFNVSAKYCKSCAKKGSRHNRYIEGLDREYPIEFKYIREIVRERDSHQCQICGKLQKNVRKKLCIHHIDYNKKNCKLGNLITLCIKCHLKTNFNRESYKEYFNILVNIIKVN